MAKNKHLTDEERKLIQYWLKARVSLKEIARNLDKSTSTVSREIRKHAVDSNKFARYKAHNRCTKRWGCPIKQLCEDRPDCTSKCSFYSRCNKICPDFDELVCDRLYSPPYVCDGCLRRGNAS